MNDLYKKMKKYAEFRNNAWELNEYTLKNNKPLLEELRDIWKNDNDRLNDLLRDIIWADNLNKNKINKILKKRVNLEINGFGISDIGIGTTIILDNNRGVGEIIKIHTETKVPYYSVRYNNKEVQTVIERFVRIYYKRLRPVF